MKFVIQRVTNASCTVEGNITGSIQKGFLVLIGISDQDTILHYMQTAGKETVHPLQTQENLIWQSKCTNISLISAKKKFRLLNRESLALT